MVKHKKITTGLLDESGVTLIELLASLAILTLIVASFLGFFIQSARTTSRTIEVDEATFLAQEKMEELVYLSSNGSIPDNFDDGESIKYESPYTVKISYNEDTNELYAVIVEVFEGDTDDDSARKAIIENRLPFDRTEVDE